LNARPDKELLFGRAFFIWVYWFKFW